MKKFAALAALITVSAAIAAPASAATLVRVSLVGKSQAQIDSDIRAAAEAHGVYDSDFDRGIFLLSKQLMYFERYGKIFLADVGLFEDEAFFRAALEAPTTASRRPPPPCP